MRNTILSCSATLIAACALAIPLAHAEPGDDDAVAKARKDYEQAMQGHDAGLQNAMKVELSVQLAKAKERRKRDAASRQQPPSAAPGHDLTSATANPSEN